MDLVGHQRNSNGIAQSRPDLSKPLRIAWASCPHRRSGNYVKGKGRARRQVLANCWLDKQRIPKMLFSGSCEKRNIAKPCKTKEKSKPFLRSNAFALSKMIFQNRFQLRGQVARIGVVVITSRARDAQMDRFWKIVSREQDTGHKW